MRVPQKARLGKQGVGSLTCHSASRIAAATSSSPIAGGTRSRRMAMPVGFRCLPSRHVPPSVARAHTASSLSLRTTSKQKTNNAMSDIFATRLRRYFEWFCTNSCSCSMFSFGPNSDSSYSNSCIQNVNGRCYSMVC